MGFWDWIIGDPNYLSLGQNERVSGNPRAARRRIGREKDRRFGFNEATDFAEQVKKRWDNRGSNPDRSTGRWVNNARSIDFGSRGREVSPIEDILATLEQLQDPSRYMSGESDYDAMARAAADAQYNPIIAALEGQMASATGRANRNKTELGNMFSALSSNLQADIPQIQQQYAGDKATTDQQYDQLQATIKDNYAQTQAEQMQMMKNLNIEAAAAETLPQQQRDRDFFTNMAATEGQTMQSALGQEERGAVNYTQQGSQIARAEGTQRQADLMADLQTLLGEYESQIGAQQAAKESAYMQLRGQYQSDAQNEALDRAQRDFENYIQMIQLGQSLRKDASGNPIGPVKSPADVASRALGMGLNDRDAQDIQNVFMSALGNDPQISAGVDPLFGGKLTNEALAQRIMELGRTSNLSREEMNALQVIALEYFGRR